MDKPTNPRMFKGRHRCPECDSSDSLGYYENSYTCFGSCDQTWFYNKGERIELLDFEEEIVNLGNIEALPFRGAKLRNIPLDVYQSYGVRSEIGEDGEPASRYYPWHIKGEITTYKQKTLDKKFYLHGNTSIAKNPDAELFGFNKFSGGGRTLVITEGEDDCCAVQRAYLQKYKKEFPVVSLFNSTATQAVINGLDKIRTYDKVILWPDTDSGAGEKCMKAVAKIIGPGKVYIVDCKEYKDANDALIGAGYEYIMKRLWNATLWNPAGFVSGNDIWEMYKDRKDKPSIPYPDCLSGLNTKLKGMRTGEIVLFTSGTGSGKSTVIKETIINIAEKDPTAKVGIVSLEEDVGESAGKIIEMDMMRELDEDSDMDEQKRHFDKLFYTAEGEDRITIVDHQGSLGDSSLIDKMSQLAAMGCKYIFLDHITIAVSEGNSGLSGNEATDKMMSDLLKLVKANDVWLGLVSHLRKVGSGNKSFEEGHMASMDDIKGSGSIKQISFDIISFSRNMSADSEQDRNTIKLMVLKARYTGKTGPAGAAYYNDKTKRLMNVGLDSNIAIDNMFDDPKGMGL
jgi:twinkle protein